MPADRIHPEFRALPLAALADAALSRARELGAQHAELRVERIRSQGIDLRNGSVTGVSDTTTIGLAVRVIVDGVWGFASHVELTPERAVATAERAVDVARTLAPVAVERVVRADEPVHAGAEWVSAYDVDPFTVPVRDKVALLAEWSGRLLASDGVDHVHADVSQVLENKFYADTAGTSTVQQRVRIGPSIVATAVDRAAGGFETMASLAPPVGRGWEYLTGQGWDFDDELARIPELLAEKVKAPSVQAGAYDLVIDPTNLWLTIHESVGHATEYDRAIGYEAAYAGTSFATPDQLGRLRYGSELMHVTGDRTVPHGLATVGYDDDGVATTEWDLVRDGVLVGYQLDRTFAPRLGLERSNGCAFADSPHHVPIQRMANVSLQPDPGRDTGVDELIAGVDRGIYVMGDKSWSIDMQRYNFQFTGQRFYRIEGGQLAGQLRDVAYQATTTDFWGAMDAVGGPSTWRLLGAMNCGKAQPGQVAAVSHGCPAARFRGVNVLNTQGGGPVRAQEVVERTLTAARHLHGCAVLVRESSEAALRWANSTMTTNGHTTSRRTTVIAFVAVEGGIAAGVVSWGSAVTAEPQLQELVRAAEAAAHDAGPAKDAAPLLDPDVDDAAWDEPAVETSIGVFGAFAEGLAEVLAGPHRQYGFATHRLSTVWLGTSTGIRRRWVQPTGSVELNAKTSDLTGSAWTGVSTADFTDVDVLALAAEADRRLGWSNRRVTLPAGRYETLLPPSAVADLMVYLAWSLDGRAAQEGRSALAGPDGPRVGEKLTALPLTLASDPSAPGLEYEPFLTATRSGEGLSVFDNGAPTRRAEWVSEGAVGELVYSRAEAAEFGTRFTPAGGNLMLTGGSAGSLADLVGRTERGLLPTCLWYIREVDPTTLLLTGLTRDGVYLVEGGEVVGEVDHNFRFNYSPLDVLRRATEVGATERTLPREWKDWFTRTAMPPARVPDFNMSSVSLGR